MPCTKEIYGYYGNMNTMAVAHIFYERDSIDSQLQSEQSSFHLFTLVCLLQAIPYYQIPCQRLQPPVNVLRMIITRLQEGDVVDVTKDWTVCWREFTEASSFDIRLTHLTSPPAENLFIKTVTCASKEGCVTIPRRHIDSISGGPGYRVWVNALGTSEAPFAESKTFTVEN
ncbi:hypothetical protein BDV39DRAFT_201605 [Aspergillus sergii]|uniref:Uncharacterized protein n=1 Tax=Aspergillus sergii TaxID=1034303 RepID=A0A5N6XF42_9EURO|nr:hypothetical protein BDV39DRAFT_201605 [Aspergillus sergii]